MSGRRRAYRRTARLESQVRYGPQQRALVGLAGELASNYKQNVRGARGTAAVTRATIRTVRPEIRKAYGRADAVRAGTTQDVAAVLANVGAAGDPFRAAIAREQAGAKSRLAESQAGALAELSRRKVDASAGAQAQVRAYAAGLREDTNRIGQQIVGLAGDRGAFEAATVQTLRDADRKLGVDLKKARLTARTARRGQDITRRGQNLSHKDRAVANRIKQQNAAAKKAKGKAKKPRLTPLQQNAAVDLVDTAVAIIRAAPASKGPHERRQALVTGQGGKKKAYPKWAVNAAMDIVYRGGLSRPNRVELRRRGVPVRPAWKAHNRRVANAVSAAGSALR